MRNFFLLTLSFYYFFLAAPVQAVVDPRQSPNNRFGIHILNPEEVKPAAELVNANGDWGYATIVLRLNDLNREKWQAVFDEMRRRHLIPIVRLATIPQNSHWVKPQGEDSVKLADFLNSLNWVIKNRYVVLFNEPNHAKEWGNEINPGEYAVIARDLSGKLKSASDDFFILPAGLDTAAPNSKDTLAATEYWRQMYLADPKIFTVFDGWNSHSYPNPGFSGSVSASGLGTIRSYLAEVNYLARFGLPSNLPVFITETGWVDTAGDLASLYTQAFTYVWQQPNLVAVTPFVLNYPQPPFKQFSWLGTAHYQAVAALSKAAGRPVQVNSALVTENNLPDEVVSSSDYRFFLELKNTGQSIWERQNFHLGIETNLPADSFFVGHVPTTEPGETARIEFDFKTPAGPVEIKLKLNLVYAGESFGEITEKLIKVVPPPTVVIAARLWYKVPGSNDQYRLLVYDADNRLLGETNIGLKLGKSEPVKLYNLVPGQAYRLVLLKPYYLPRQTWVVLGKGENQAGFKSMLPVDFNNDGRLSFADFFTWLLQPLHYLGLALKFGD